MGGSNYLGELEHIVLAATMRLGKEAYGVAIIGKIREETRRRVASGSLSITLDRLERKGYLRTRMGEPDPERGGRPKRFVAVTPLGLRTVRKSRTAMLNLWNGLENRLDKP